eukprot:2711142-Rhodomonas_salina.7
MLCYAAVPAWKGSLAMSGILLRLAPRTIRELSTAHRIAQYRTSQSKGGAACATLVPSMAFVCQYRTWRTTLLLRRIARYLQCIASCASCTFSWPGSSTTC